jgi:hypothetical protein
LPVILQLSQILNVANYITGLQYVHTVFSLAAPSLNVNGLESSALSALVKREQVDLEPYDRRLHDRLQGLYENLEKETLSVSRLRRDGGPNAVKAFQDSWDRELLSVEELLKVEKETVDQREKDDVLNLKPLERQENVEMDYARGLEMLRQLKSKFPATTAKLERASESVAYAESK